MLRPFTVICSAILLSHAAYGQAISAMTPAAPTYDALRQALGLTDAQVQQLQQMQKEHAASNQAVFQQMAAKQKQLSEALNSGSSDAFTIGQLELDMANLRKQTNSNSNNHDRVMALLDDSQRVKLATLEKVMQLQRAVNEAVSAGFLSYPQGQVVTMPYQVVHQDFGPAVVK